MKKILALMLLCATIMFTACSDDDDKIIPVTSVELDKSILSLETGKTATLVATITPENAENKNVEWTTSDVTIATVDDGLVTAVKEGKAIITVASIEDPTKKATCEVTVVKTVIAVTEVILDESTASIEEGKTQMLTATINPTDATEKSVTWTTSDATIATVADGLVTAVKAGIATIIVTSTGDVTKKATCEVTVTPAEIAVTSVTLNKTTASIEEGQKEALTVTVAPDDAANKGVIWTTSDESIATVADGLVTAIKAGSVTITATSEGNADKKATCEVSVFKKIFSDGFEDIYPGVGWMMVDSDGDGKQWDGYNSKGAGHNSSGCMKSNSYEGGALTPDNLLVSPQVTLPASGQFEASWWISAQDQTDFREKYSVYVLEATQNHEDLLSDVQAYLALGNAIKTSIQSTTPAYTQTLDAAKIWTNHSITIPSNFAGKNIYIIFRHYDCTNMFYIKLDDVVVIQK